MADTKKGRDKQAHDETRRQQERDIEEARSRGDETEPTEVEQDGATAERREEDPPRTCHRRGCEERATFVVVERYLEETGHGAVEATAFLCTDHTREESPTNLAGVYEDYVFRVLPVAGTVESGGSDESSESDELSGPDAA